MDVYVVRGDRRELMATVSPGRTELPIAAEDRRFLAFPPGSDRTLHAYPVDFTVVCRGGPAGTR